MAALVANEKDMQVVGEASNGREAIAQFHTLRPDVTLLDLQMPEMDGMDALVAIRKVYSSARIIVLTTYGGDVLARRALEAGAQGYVLKGMIRKELLDAIRAARARRSEKSKFGCRGGAGRPPGGRSAVRPGTRGVESDGRRQLEPPYR